MPNPVDRIAVRRIGFSDLPQVVGIERRAFPTPWSPAMFVLELAKPSTIALGAVLADPRSGQDLAGYVICSRYAEVWHIMNVAVDPPVRRRGIGSALLEAMIEQAGAEEPFTLEVRPSNTGAIALYERFGFRAAGTRPRYYHDTGEDALIMWRTAESQLQQKVS
ncbi:MAG TPA: ribosomal protein S18-alanine N-acetyltransferase [Solirubrobacteraceae bacterium]|nr:ribosomal protein S18-alanine N-acetyltransferase [Solirubrobacteraceae bacterium]